MCRGFWRFLLMDVNHKTDNTGTIKDFDGVDSPTSVVSLDADSEGEDESQSLLQHHPRSGGLSKHSHKPGRKVQWLDRNGSQLAEILEFQPSEASDSDDDESDSCICRIM